MKKIKSYTGIWNVEKVLYAINDFNLPFPVTFTQITWFVITEFIIILFGDIPPLSMIEGAFLKYFGIPVALTWFMSQKTFDGKNLCANVAAQIVAFACGKADDNKNKNFEGGRPSSIIIGDQVNPASLGALLAHFENKIMFQGFLWNVNSFDQEGVQLGKLLAKKVLAHETDGALKELSDMLNI